MKFFKYIWQLNESANRDKIYQILLNRNKVYIPNGFDMEMEKLVNRTVVRPELKKIKDKIVVGLCRLIAETVIDRIKEDFNSTFNDEHEKQQLKDLLEVSSKGPVNSSATAYETKLKSQLEADLEDGLTEILDYINSPVRNIQTEPINFDTVTWFELLTASRDFHNRLSDGVNDSSLLEYDTYDDVIMQFNDGFYWVDLNTNICKDEAIVMGHCGTDTNADTLYSLRKKIEINGRYFSQPCLTASIKFKANSENKDGQQHIDISKSIVQLKGKGNSKPKAIYFPYIVDLLLNSVNTLRTWDGYKPWLNFHISDLDDMNLKKIISHKPEYLDDIIKQGDTNLKEELVGLLKNPSYIDYITSFPEDTKYKILGKKFDNVLVVYRIINGTKIYVLKYVVDGIIEPQVVSDPETGEDTPEYLIWFKEVNKVPPALRKWSENLGLELYSY